MTTTTLQKPSQCDEILAHLYSIDQDTGKRRGISPHEALGVYQIDRLAARIYDLRKRGYAIKCVMRRDNRGKRYTRYFLKTEK